MTSKQIKELKKGEYSNSELNKMFPEHCKPKGARPETHLHLHKSTKKEPFTGYISILKNRRQRRQGVSA